MEEVEKRVLAWLRERHPSLQSDVKSFLGNCIAQRHGDGAIFKDLDEALCELERIQSGML
jgi:hypothetical protein